MTTGYKLYLVATPVAAIRLRAIKIDTPISDDIDYRILMPVSQITHKNEHEGKTQRSGKVDDPGCVNVAG